MATRSRTMRSTATDNGPASSAVRKREVRLINDPVARFSAPNPRGRAASIASSIKTSRTRPDGESDEDDVEPVRELEHEYPEDQEDESQADEPSEDHAVKLQVLTSLVPDLLRATDELHNRLKNGDYGNEVFLRILNAKRRAFLTQLEDFQDPSDKSLFIDYLWVGKLGFVFETDVGIPAAIIRANVVMALFVIRSPPSEFDEKLGLLHSLNFSFPRLFIPAGSDERHPRVALAIRTAYCIHELAARGVKGDARAVIASVFCEDGGGRDYPKLFSNGPFKPLGGGDMDGRTLGSGADDDTFELCAGRVQELYEMTRKRKMHGVDELMGRYPFETVMSELADWLLGNYASLKDKERRNEKRHDVDESHGASEIADESDSDSTGESQPIMRPAGDDAPRPSMFSGIESIKQLQQSAMGIRQAAPPSHQPSRRRAPSNAPSDYAGDNTRNLLLSLDTLPPSSSLPRLGNKRPRVDDADDSDEDNEEFETDRRPVDKSRRSNLNASLAHKRTAVPSSMPPPPTRSPYQPRVAAVPPTHPVTASSQADFGSIRYRKASAAAQARVTALQGTAPQSSAHASLASSVYNRERRREPWSDHDADVLIRLVRECGASWSRMQVEPYVSRFEYPRHQQAYRDKARNLKVDFLITDAVLPPGFDLVALGKKEIDRVISLGKNPYRKQVDVEDDRATNTEWMA